MGPFRRSLSEADVCLQTQTTKMGLRRSVSDPGARSQTRGEIDSVRDGTHAATPAKVGAYVGFS